MKGTLFALNNATKTARLSATNRSNSSPFFLPSENSWFSTIYYFFECDVSARCGFHHKKAAADSYHISYTGGIENVSIVFSDRFVISAAIFVAIVIVVHLPRFFIAIVRVIFTFLYLFGSCMKWLMACTHMNLIDKSQSSIAAMLQQ